MQTHTYCEKAVLARRIAWLLDEWGSNFARGMGLREGSHAWEMGGPVMLREGELARRSHDWELARRVSWGGTPAEDPCWGYLQFCVKKWHTYMNSPLPPQKKRAAAAAGAINSISRHVQAALGARESMWPRSSRAGVQHPKPHSGAGKVVPKLREKEAKINSKIAYITANPQNYSISKKLRGTSIAPAHVLWMLIPK